MSYAHVHFLLMEIQPQDLNVSMEEIPNLNGVAMQDD
jgi:hypothetical protein